MRILNDYEHRLFLAAMGREREVCKNVEAEHSLLDNEKVPLVPIVASIERKVDAAYSAENITDMKDKIKNLSKKISGEWEARELYIEESGFESMDIKDVLETDTPEGDLLRLIYNAALDDALKIVDDALK